MVKILISLVNDSPPHSQALLFLYFYSKYKLCRKNCELACIFIQNTNYAATIVNQLVFLFKIQIMPLILTNVDIHDFPLNLSNETMM